MLAWIALASAADPAALLARLDEVESVRHLRIADDVPSISRDAYLTAAQGDIETGVTSVPGHGAKKVWGVGVVNVPIDRYWAAISDNQSHPEYTRLSSSELVAGSPCTGPRSVLQFLPVPIIADRWWVTNLTPNPDIRQVSSGDVREVAWTSSSDPSDVTTERGRELIREGTPIAFSEGAWFMVALDEHTTLVEYYSWTDPGGRAPAGLTSRFAAGGVKDTIAGMERLAKDGPTCGADDA